MVKLDVVLRGGASLKADSLANDKRDGLSFGFADALRGAGTALIAMQHFMRELMNERRELFRRRLARQEGDFPA